MRAVLTIAGSDSIAGAGIQADLKTLAALGVYGTSAITAITAQNTSQIAEVLPVAPEAVRSQIHAVAQDVTLAAIKTGMLATADIARAVAGALRELARPNLVVDPVISAGAPGRRILLTPDAVEIVKTQILPQAAVV